MIDSTQETLITLKVAGEVLGRHVATIHRWASHGVRGVVLETLQVGGTRCTSREALQRFFERLSSIQPSKHVKAGVGAQRAAEELSRHGV